MTEAIIEVALETLNSLIQKQLGLFLGVDREMKRLSEVLTTIKAVLEDAEEKQITNKALKIWLRKLRDAAYLLDDILDECSTHALSLEYKANKCGFPNTVQASCLYSFHPSHIMFCYKIAKKLKDISQRIDEIAEERLKFHLRDMVPERRNEVMEWRQTTSFITQPQFYGREAEKEKIVDFLVHYASNFEDVSVYPIVGIGGLGKTTLAQQIFNNKRVANHFELKIWICVSEDFNLKRLSKVIIESAGHTCEDLDLEPLQQRLQGVVGGKRYLLVMDDVWNDNQEKWDKLKYVLACGSKGSSILVTTRLMKIACITGTVPPHKLSLLSDDDCWELFKQRAFGPDKKERAELVAIGREIVKKCRGVPLAAKTLGSILHFKSVEKDWLYIKDSEIWNLPQDEYSILPALRLSYLNLPTKLRQCFAFCALFPKDEIISKEFIIELWMAVGLISSDERLEVEDDGDRVWNELYLRSFFEDVETGGTWFKMHDLVHDLAQSVVEEECCCITQENMRPNQLERTFHLSYGGRKAFDGQWLSHLHLVKSLRTFITPNGPREFNIEVPAFYDILLKCDHLRALDLKGLKELPSSIGQLKHLRYLNISFGFFNTLPKSICKLWNLQILNLHSCLNLQELPNQLNHLKSLRHLHLEDCKSLSKMAPGIGQLTCLKSLAKYVVGSHKGFLLSEIKNLKLEGTLHIKHLERVTSVTDAKAANLVDKRLNKLKLSWERNEESQCQGNEEHILEVLQPHSQLKRLHIERYFGSQLPHWMRISTLRDLTFLKLNGCKNVFCLSSLKDLPSLGALVLQSMEHLQYVDDGSYVDGVARAFNLTLLRLAKLPSLTKLSSVDGDNMFPCLGLLQIYQCPNLILPCLPSVTTLVMFKECNRALLLSIQNLHNLERLWFLKDKEVTSFPDGMLQCFTCLKELHICELEKLEVLPRELSSLNALQVLRIEKCNNLDTLTEEALQGLCSLKKLAIFEYAKFKLSPGFKNLVALEDLTIVGCPEVEDLHESLQLIKGLQSLILDNLPNLASLPDWFGNLTSLKSLTIHSCPKLTSLPNSTQRLINLKDLKIYACPELVQRCTVQTGDDWHKIAHVPRTQLNPSSFQPTHGFHTYDFDKSERDRRFTLDHACSRPVRDEQAH